MTQPGQLPVASLEQLQVAHFNVACPTEEEVAAGQPPLLKIEMILMGGTLVKWCYIEPRVAQALGDHLRQGGEKCASLPGPSGLIIADEGSQTAAERFFDGLNRPQG